MAAPNAEKGARYLALLDQALCAGNWAEVPELARKVDKHAPERRCITLTARIEAQVAAARPATAQRLQMDEEISKLTEAVNGIGISHEDRYIAEACISEVCWLREEWDNALNALPEALSPNSNAKGASMLGWLEVCDVRSSIIRATSMEKKELDMEARELYLAAAQRTPASRSPELRRWTERLLARACAYTYRRCSTPTVATLGEALRCFMAWSDFWRRAPLSSLPSVGTWSSSLDLARRDIWKNYYNLFSTILQQGLLYNPSATSPSTLLRNDSDGVPVEQVVAFKIRQRSTFVEVEAAYESLLLNETKFPTADQSNVETEKWIDQVMANWSIFCDGRWSDDELGEGGRSSASRGVLDILYRAATKTFHSTSILRHLFHVHAVLGEFDLALHAFDSFAELINRARARAEKSGEHTPESDTASSAIRTAGEAIRVLCRYGGFEQAEKAFSISVQLQSWLVPAESQLSRSPTNRVPSVEHAASEQDVSATGLSLDKACLASAYLAIGVARAHWARLTFNPELREPLQTEALQYLRRAKTDVPDSLEITYALVLVLIEVGEMQAATQLLKRTIASAGSIDDDETHEPDYDVAYKQRQLVPMWHLLGLCLTARDEYEQAARMLEAAFDQFGDITILLGNEDSTSAAADRSIHSNPLVDRMEGFEKEGLLQIKITQLALVELTEGPDAALDMTHALLSLYARLFGVQEMSTPPRHNLPNTSASPATKINPLRSLAGTIRPKSARASAERETPRRTSIFSTSQPSAVSVAGQPQDNSNIQTVGAPISITVTNEEGQTASKHHHKHLPFKLRASPGDWRHSRSTENLQKKTAGEKSHPTIPPVPEASSMSASAANSGNAIAAQAAVAHSAAPGISSGPRQTLGKIPHNASQNDWPPPAGHDEQPPQQDVRLPAPHPAAASAPEPRPQSLQERQHKIGLLVHIWLVIAGIYIRSDMPSDAAEAIDEAGNLVEGFEAEVSSDKSQARRFSEKGWGGGKGVDELWADVLSAVGPDIRNRISLLMLISLQKGELASARNLPFEAMSLYDRALSHHPDHANGTIGVSNILMDIYEGKLPVEPSKPMLPLPSTSTSQILTEQTTNGITDKVDDIRREAVSDDAALASDDPPPSQLNRLAARDRAYMLLSNLTRLGSSWDNPEAWYSLARAHELSRQVFKAKQALWWVVELEENRPLRAWREISAGGFTL